MAVKKSNNINIISRKTSNINNNKKFNKNNKRYNNNSTKQGCKQIRKNKLNQQFKSNQLEKKLIVSNSVLKSSQTNEKRCGLVQFSFLRTVKSINQTNDYNYALNILFHRSLSPNFVSVQPFSIFVYIFLLSPKYASRSKLKNIEIRNHNS